MAVDYHLPANTHQFHLLLCTCQETACGLPLVRCRGGDSMLPAAVVGIPNLFQQLQQIQPHLWLDRHHLGGDAVGVLQLPGDTGGLRNQHSGAEWKKKP